MTTIPIACQSEGALEVYVEPVLPTPHLVVVGRSPMAHTLADLAKELGWRTSLIDSAEFSAADVTDRSMVVVATQGHGDEEVLELAVSAYPAFIGLVGSRRRGESVIGYLADRGVPKNLLDRVKVPVGIDLGHTSHREIAVAILAELVQVRASRWAGVDRDDRLVGPPVGHHGYRSGVRDDGGARPVHAVDPARRGGLLLLLRGLSDELRARPRRLPEGAGQC